MIRSDILDKARREFAAVQSEHANTVHKAHATILASKKRYDAAKKRVMDLEFAVISAEASMRAEARKAR